MILLLPPLTLGLALLADRTQSTPLPGEKFGAAVLAAPLIFVPPVAAAAAAAAVIGVGGYYVLEASRGHDLSLPFSPKTPEVEIPWDKIVEATEAAEATAAAALAAAGMRVGKECRWVLHPYGWVMRYLKRIRARVRADGQLLEMLSKGHGSPLKHIDQLLKASGKFAFNGWQRRLASGGIPKHGAGAMALMEGMFLLGDILTHLRSSAFVDHALEALADMEAEAMKCYASIRKRFPFQFGRIIGRFIMAMKRVIQSIFSIIWSRGITTLSAAIVSSIATGAFTQFVDGITDEDIDSIGDVLNWWFAAQESGGRDGGSARPQIPQDIADLSPGAGALGTDVKIIRPKGWDIALLSTDVSDDIRSLESFGPQGLVIPGGGYVLLARPEGGSGPWMRSSLNLSLGDPSGGTTPRYTFAASAGKWVLLENSQRSLSFHLQPTPLDPFKDVVEPAHWDNTTDREFFLQLALDPSDPETSYSPSRFREGTLPAGAYRVAMDFEGDVREILGPIEAKPGSDYDLELYTAEDGQHVRWAER